MKKLGTIFVALAAVVAMGTTLAAPASATQFWLETFSYAPGGLVANSGGNWTMFSGSGTDIQVTGGQAEGNNGTRTPDDSRGFTARAIGDSTYACFQVTIPQPTTTPIVGGYFAFFKDGTTTNFNSRVFALPIVGDAAHYQLGVGVSSASSLAQIGVHPTVLSFGTKYNVVIKYAARGCTIGCGEGRIWVNPGGEGSTSAFSTTTSNANGGGGIPINAFALREASGGSPTAGTVNWLFVVDNIGVGTSFNDACTGSITKAASSTWGKLRSTYR